MCHAWITCGIVGGDVLMMDKLSRKYQKSTTWHASGSLIQVYHAWNTHERACRFVLVTDRPQYTWNYLSCATQSCGTDRHGEINLTKSILTDQSFQIRLTNVGLQSSFSTLVVHTHQVPLATHQVPLAKSEE